MWDFVDDFRFLANPTLDRWGFQTWSYKRAPYATPTDGVLLTDQATKEGGTRLEWNTPDPENFDVPLVGIYANLGIGIMHPGPGGPTPLVSAVEWTAWRAGTYVVRVDLWPTDGSQVRSPNIGWSLIRRYIDGNVEQLDGGIVANLFNVHTIKTVSRALVEGDRVYFVIDQGTDPNDPASSYTDTVGFRLTLLRPGQ